MSVGLIINTNDDKSVKMFKLVNILARGRLGVFIIIFMGKYFKEGNIYVFSYKNRLD